MNACYEAARSYLSMGLHPIPAEGKRPIVDWKLYQAEAPHADAVDSWWDRWPDANVGLVVGRGIIVVDLDGDGAEGLLHNAYVALPKDAPRVRTGNGYHVYLSVDEQVGDRIGLLTAPGGGKPQVDVRGIGFVVAPPSRHPSGRQYEWVTPFTGQIPRAPDALMRLLRAPKPQAAQAPSPDARGWVASALRGVGEGLRDATCTKLAGYFIGKGLDEDTVTALLTEGFARNCTPPFTAGDVRKCVQSIARKHGVTGEQDRTIAPQRLSSVLDDLGREMASGGVKGVVVPPFPTLESFLGGGFYPGELIYVGARPGVGKTALGLEVARRAGKARVASLVVSREMVNVALARRLLAQEARVNAASLRRNSLGEGERVLLTNALPRLKGLPIFMTDEAVSITEITDMIAGWSAPEPLGLVLVDYLQLIRAPKDIKERRLQVEAVSQALKTIALQFKIPVICLSSLARPPADGKDKRPTLASLRESGELEHDADVVLLLHREPMKPETECIVAKNRDGRQGTVHLMFRHEFVAFDEVADRNEG